MRWTDLLYRIAAGLLSMLVAFVIGWYAASRHTMTTMSAWYQPETNMILIQDYMGNIDEYYGPSNLEKCIEIWRKYGRLE